MRYVHAVQGAFIAFILFVIATVFIPGVGPSREVEIILTISTFLFAILAGFFISRLSSRFDHVRRMVGEEDSYWLCFYKTAQLFGEKFANKVRDLMDKYYITAYDFNLYYYKANAKYFLQIWDEVIKLGKFRHEAAYETMLNQLTEIEKRRNTSSTISSEKLSLGQWTVLIFLAGIILFSIFYLKTSQLYSHVITVLLSTILILVLLIVRDLQNFMLGGESICEESGEEVLEFIGKPRYYNQIFLEKGIDKVPEDVKEYRVGMHEPGAERFNIKMVRRERKRE